MIDYKEINKECWNKRAVVHFDSDFYDNKSFIAGRNALNDIELDLLGDVTGKSVLHLQCHFGQDTISFDRLGASRAVGIDLSDVSVDKARQLAEATDSKAEFICCDIYDTRKHTQELFDIVFSSYGTIGWHPDMDKWADVVVNSLKPGGTFVFAEFHPVIWMYDEKLEKISYDYFNTEVIVEDSTSTYTDNDAILEYQEVNWNHSIGEVLSALINAGLTIEAFAEYDYSPYPCFQNLEEVEKGRWRFNHIDKLIPIVYSLRARKQG